MIHFEINNQIVAVNKRLFPGQLKIINNKRMKLLSYLLLVGGIAATREKLELSAHAAQSLDNLAKFAKSTPASDNELIAIEKVSDAS